MWGWIAVLVILIAVAVAIAGRLVVRSRMPESGWFTDPARAANSLSVIGTMVAVVLAFVILFALQNFQRARDGASIEAVAVNELRADGDVLEGGSDGILHGGLVCYSRAVISDEWPAMQAGRASDVVQSWVDTLDRDFAAANPVGTKQVAAYSQWFDQQAQRREGRRTRLAEIDASVPLPLWFVLGVGAAAIILYMWAQADRREHPVIQSIPIGFITALLASGMVVIFFLDHPYANWHGSIQPVEMQRSLSIIEDGHSGPCDEHGNPRPKRAEA